MLNRILSVLFPLIFGVLFLRLGFISVYEYYLNPADKYEGVVQSKFYFLQKNIPINGDSKELLIQSDEDINTVNVSEVRNYVDSIQLNQANQWLAEKKDSLICSKQKFTFSNRSSFLHEYEKLKGFHEQLNTFKFDDKTSLTLNQKFYYIKRVGINILNDESEKSFYSRDLDSFNDAHLNAPLTVYYYNFKSSLNCYNQYKLISFTALGAAFGEWQEDWMVNSFFICCGLACIGLVLFNLKRGGQQDG